MDRPGSPSQSPVLPKQPTPGGERPRAAPHTTRLGRYRITGRLGKGGMGVVYEAEDTLLKRQVAIKLLPREVSTNPEALRRFLREAQAAARLNHPNVVAIYDLGETRGTHYIVMELIAGGSAQDCLRRHGPFHWQEATNILIAVCRGTAAAHKAGLIHRDIKPANILRSTEGVVKLGDFGLVKPAGRKGTVVTTIGAVIGTPHYMSPEQSQTSAVDERSDVYSLGATYFALLTGRPPFQHADSMQVLFAHCSLPVPDPRTFDADIPEQCTAIIRKAMAKHRADRHAGAGELQAQLEELLAQTDGKTTADTHAVPPPVASWSKEGTADSPDPLSFADAYPGEQSADDSTPEQAPHKRLWPGFLVGLLLVCLALSLAVFLLSRTGEPVSGQTVEPVAVTTDDWASLATAAERAIHNRDAAAMKTVLEKIRIVQKREQGKNPAQQEAMRQTLARLEKALTFRERITERGLVLGLDGLVTSVVFSPDDRWLAVGQGSGDAGALVWDSHTGEKRFTVWPRRNNVLVPVQALAFSHDSAVLAAAWGDTLGVRLWRWANGKETTLPAVTGVKRTLTVAFAPSSKNLVAGFEPYGEGKGKPYLKVWNVDTLQEPFPFKAEHSDKVVTVAFSAGGEQVATGSHDKRVVMWNATTGRIWREIRTGMTIQALACAPQGRMLAVSGVETEGPRLQFWDYAGERLLASRTLPHGPCRCVAFSRNGALLASGSGAAILLWNPDTQELLATLTGHGLDVTALAFSADGGILATGSDDQTMRLWDVSRFLSRRSER